MEPNSPLTGACQCGAVRLHISEPLLGAAICHCNRCQRRTGTAFSVSGLTANGSFAITEGQEHVGSWTPPDDGWVKSFCTLCGSQLFTSSQENPDLVAVRLGALDQDPGVRPGVHQFVDYAPAWAPVPDDGLPRWPERMGWEGDRPAT
jgi:hypothetical protein